MTQFALHKTAVAHGEAGDRLVGRQGRRWGGTGGERAGSVEETCGNDGRGGQRTDGHGQAAECIAT